MKTAEEYKREAVELWTWLADNPSQEKQDYPHADYSMYRGQCPLCEYFCIRVVDHRAGCCFLCPLGNCDIGSVYHKWNNYDDYTVREEYAREILTKIMDWDTSATPDMNDLSGEQYADFYATYKRNREEAYSNALKRAKEYVDD